MSILRRAAGLAEPEQRSILDGYGQPGLGSWSSGMVWNPGSIGSASVDQAMQLSAVFACLRLKSEAVATLPFDTFARVDRARVPVPPPDYLTFAPPLMSRVVYLSMLMLSGMTDGNAFVATPRDAMGVPIALVPLDPTMVHVRRNERGRIVFDALGQEWTEMDIMHIPGMMLPGQLRGISPLRAAREVIDSGRKAQEFGRSFFDNSAVPPAVIEMPAAEGNDTEAEGARARRMASTWNETHGGTANAGKIGVLIGGAKLNTIAISPEDAEWLDSKRFTVSEIARFYGVPPHLIADASNSTSWGSGLAEQNLAFGQFSLRPDVTRIEDGHDRLLYTHGAGGVFTKLNLDALLRASLSDRYEAYKVGIDAGFLDDDEVRALEDLPPREPGVETATLAPEEIAIMLQKIYLSVGVLITPEEAREIMNRAGAGLTGAWPGGTQ